MELVRRGSSESNEHPLHLPFCRPSIWGQTSPDTRIKLTCLPASTDCRLLDILFTVANLYVLTGAVQLRWWHATADVTNWMISLDVAIQSYIRHVCRRRNWKTILSDASKSVSDCWIWIKHCVSFKMCVTDLIDGRTNSNCQQQLINAVFLFTEWAIASCYNVAN